VQNAKNKLLGFIYPALQPEKNGTISIRLLPDQATSRRISRKGLIALYSQQFPKQFKFLKKECVLPSSLWALYEGLDPRQKLNEDLYHFVLEAIFACTNRLWPQKDEFFELIASLKKEGLINRSRKLSDLVLQVQNSSHVPDKIPLCHKHEYIS
jgi:hypothetical protein